MSWNNFLLKKKVSKTGRRVEELSQDAQDKGLKKSTRNPTPIEPIEE